MIRWAIRLLARIAWFLLLAIAAALLIAASFSIAPSAPVLAVFLAVFTIASVTAVPSILYRHLPTEFWRGESALSRKDFESARHHTQRFLDQLARWPGLNFLIRMGSPLGSGSLKAQALVNLGRATYALGEKVEARTALMKAIKIEPSNAEAFVFLAMICFDDSDREAGRAWIAKAAAGSPSGPDAHFVELAQTWPYSLEDFQAMASAAEGNLNLPCRGKVQIRLLNDDKTQMGFVVLALQEVLGLSQLDAIRVMLTIDRDGSAVCGAFEPRIAEAKLARLIDRAKEAGFSLKGDLITTVA